MVATSNGSRRLTIIQNMPTVQQIQGTPNNVVPYFGVTNSTT